MKWIPAKLIGPVEVGEDNTRTPITQPMEIGTAMVRRSPYGIIRDATEGNGATIERFQYLTRKPREAFEGVTKIEVGGETYKLDKKPEIAEPYTVLTVSRAKP